LPVHLHFFVEQASLVSVFVAGYHPKTGSLNNIRRFFM
jgi:hypothetical protein